MTAERIASVFWFICGVIAAHGGYQLGLGTKGEPGSGFLTFCAGIFIALMAAILFWQSWRKCPENQARLADLWRGTLWYRAVAIVVLTAIFIMAFEYLGFLICGFVLLVVIFRGLERLPWKISLIAPAITVGATYILFSYLLKTSLPAGVFGF